MQDLPITIVTMDRPSVLEETLRNLSAKNVLENVLVVDGSEGLETKQVCQAFDVQHYFQRSSGMTAARNEVLQYVDSEYVAFIDDDVRVSDSWYNAVAQVFEDSDDVVGVTGKLNDEELEFGGISGGIRELVFGGCKNFGQILRSGVVNGDFSYDKRKEVDHMPGCNMAFDVEALQKQGGFDEEFDAGTSFGEDTAASLRVAREGRIVYEPDASLKHLKVGENRDDDRRAFYDSYMTRFLQQKYGLVTGPKGLAENAATSLLRYGYYFISSSKRGSFSRFSSYVKGDLLGLWDFWLHDRAPSDRFWRRRSFSMW